QLWIFTYSCDVMARESMNIASAAYTAPWIYLPMDRFGKMIRKDLQVVIMRSRRACYLTACGFFPISLETFTKLLSLENFCKKIRFDKQIIFKIILIYVDISDGSKLERSL
ncbi:hypothetical protein WN51_06615, partial [Melipona quadrifasciata]